MAKEYKEYVEYTFKIPSLPKATYSKLQELRVKYELTQHAVVILAIDLAYLAESTQPNLFKETVLKLKEGK